MKNAFAEKTKSLLDEKSISQLILAEALGISAARLNNYLQGKTEPSYAVLKKAALFLGSGADYLLGRTPNPLSAYSDAAAPSRLFDGTGSHDIIFTQTNGYPADQVKPGDAVYASSSVIPGKGKPAVFLEGGLPFAARLTVSNSRKACGAVHFTVRRYPEEKSSGSFAERVKGLLKFRGIRQADLARSLDITPARLNSYLSERAEAPLGILGAVADALGVTADYILGLSTDCGKGTALAEIRSSHGGTNEKTGAPYINMPVFDSVSREKAFDIKCAAVLKTVYGFPYGIIIRDFSMAPEFAPGDLAVAVSKTYAPPVLNDADTSAYYAVRLSPEDRIGLSLRYCLSKDHVMFLRPADTSFETIYADLRKVAYVPLAGRIAYRIRYA